jgi:hypothetical protein
MNNNNNSYFEEELENLNCKFKPVYLTDDTLKCGIIKYGNKRYLLDFNDRDNIINFSKNFVFVNNNDIYPSYSLNYKRFTYMDFIFTFNRENIYYVFKNNNPYDLRRSNVEIYHFYHKNIIENYNVIEYINGHNTDVGHNANIMKNPLWKIKENDKEILLMYCEKNTICILCPESYQKIKDFEKMFDKRLTWYKCGNGYIQTHSSDGKLYYIHQIITGCYGNGKGTTNISVDHIDQNPLNNTWENLRIATRKEQEQNCNGIKPGTKRERKSSARDLPEGISQDMMRKYVVYYHEYLNKEKTKSREFFKVERHPKLDKIWIGSKSNKFTIQEKLLQANKVVDDLENDIYPEKKDEELPKYVSLIISRNKPHLVFEKRTDNKRLNIKMVLPDEYDLHEQLSILNERIKEKYDVEKIIVE